RHRPGRAERRARSGGTGRRCARGQSSQPSAEEFAQDPTHFLTSAPQDRSGGEHFEVNAGDGRVDRPGDFDRMCGIVLVRQDEDLWDVGRLCVVVRLRQVEDLTGGVTTVLDRLRRAVYGDLEGEAEPV